jgi:type II secretory pathway pseudopilin PulG
MKSPSPYPRWIDRSDLAALPQRRQNGFALVVSLSLMTLLVVLGLSLLTLSSKALSTSTRELDLAEARANARVALAMAIAQLQKQTGPDQRVTTTADQLASGNGEQSAAGEGRNHWTGVYRSWAAGSTTRPQPEFLQWLVSGDVDEMKNVATAKSSGNDGVEMVGEGTVGSKDDLFVKVPGIHLDSAAGGSARMAWWTGDQGVKAAMATPPSGTANGSAEVRAGLQAAPRNAVEFAASNGNKPFDKLDPGDSRVSLVTGWKQSAFLANDVESPKPLFHDLAPFSTGLLTNVRSGGFRKDLSMQLERAATVANSTLASSRTALYTVGGENGINLHEMWAYYNLYKALKTSGGATYTTGGRIPSGAPFLQMEASAAACQNDDNFYFKWTGEQSPWGGEPS